MPDSQSEYPLVSTLFTGGGALLTGFLVGFALQSLYNSYIAVQALCGLIVLKFTSTAVLRLRTFGGSSLRAVCDFAFFGRARIGDRRSLRPHWVRQIKLKIK